METKLDIWSIYIWGRVNRERGKGEGNATDATEWWGIFPTLPLQHRVGGNDPHMCLKMN